MYSVYGMVCYEKKKFTVQLNKLNWLQHLRKLSTVIPIYVFVFFFK